MAGKNKVERDSSSVRREGRRQKQGEARHKKGKKEAANSKKCLPFTAGFMSQEDDSEVCLRTLQ